MRHVMLRWLQVFSLLLLPLFAAAEARAQASSDSKAITEKIQAALEEMHSWLGDDDNAKAWRRQLRSADLEAQLKLGEKADPQVVDAILKKYYGSNPGLTKRRFVAVRDSLETWLEQLSSVPVGELPAMARKAKEHFAPVTEKEVASAKKALDRAIVDLQKLLSRSGAKVEAGWKKRLHWKDMMAQLEAKEGPDLRVLVKVKAAYYVNKNGLDMRQFVGVRDNLSAYINALYYSKQNELQKSYNAKLDQLAKLLTDYAAKPGTTNALAIGRTLGWLESAGQAKTLVSAVRSHYWTPNLIGHASSDLIAFGIEEAVDDKMRVHEVILGTDINGTAHTVGNVTMELVPNNRKAVVNIKLKGNATSNNIGYNGPVTIYNTGRTKVSAVKQLELDFLGLRGLATKAQCTTRTTVNDIAAGRIASNVAWDRVSQQKGQAEYIASRRAEARVKRRMDQRVSKLLDKANNAYVGKFRKPLLRRDAFPPSLNFSTTSDQLRFAVVQASAFQLGAATAPPKLNGQHDLAVRVHESLVGNISESMLGGVTMTDERLAKLLENLTGEVPEELKITDDKEPWSITFAPEQPITMEFAGGKAKITIKGRRFTRGERQINDPMIITANYTLEKTPEGMNLKRQGEISAEYIGVDQQSVLQTSFKSIIKKKFNALFKEEIVGKGLQLPGRWEKLGKLRLRQLNCDSGWLALGWEAPTKDVRTAKKENKEKKTEK